MPVLQFKSHFRSIAYDNMCSTSILRCKHHPTIDLQDNEPHVELRLKNSQPYFHESTVPIHLLVFYLVLDFEVNWVHLSVVWMGSNGNNLKYSVVQLWMQFSSEAYI